MAKQKKGGKEPDKQSEFQSGSRRLNRTFFLILLAGAALLVFFVAKALNPQYVDLLIHDPQGRNMLYGAIVMQVLGMLMIKKIVNIKI